MESALKNITEATNIRLDRLFPKKPAMLRLLKKTLYRLTHWETWDWRIKYILIAPAWFWFCVRARSPWFFTASNPTLTFGGFDGESKKEMYAQLPAGSYPKSFYVSPEWSFAKIEKIADQLALPCAVKPDRGKMGLMFRKINTLSELRSYHERMPCNYILQEFIDYPLEVSVFYYRLPGTTKGTITGFIRKDFLEVVGDGRSTLLELIMKYPRVRFRIEEMKAKHSAKLSHVIAPGEKYCLSPALNLSRGGRLVTLEKEKDERLLKFFDNISHYTGNFYYGRYDIRCRSVEDLKAGKHFSILEYNGSGAEPHHVYGNGYNLFQACGILISHWQMLYRISRMNNRNGVPYWDLKRGWCFMKKAARHSKALRKVDATTVFT